MHAKMYVFTIHAPACMPLPPCQQQTAQKISNSITIQGYMHYKLQQSCMVAAAAAPLAAAAAAAAAAPSRIHCYLSMGHHSAL
jgi:hypothetical protein